MRIFVHKDNPLKLEIKNFIDSIIHPGLAGAYRDRRIAPRCR